jgi:hypothetical protein
MLVPHQPRFAAVHDGAEALVGGVLVPPDDAPAFTLRCSMRLAWSMPSSAK